MNQIVKENNDLIYLIDRITEYLSRDKVNEHVKHLWASGEKLEAIKYYKYAKDKGLKEAKDEVEELCKDVQYGSTWQTIDPKLI